MHLAWLQFRFFFDATPDVPSFRCGDFQLLLSFPTRNPPDFYFFFWGGRKGRKIGGKSVPFKYVNV